MKKRSMSIKTLLVTAFLLFTNACFAAGTPDIVTQADLAIEHLVANKVIKPGDTLPQQLIILNKHHIFTDNDACCEEPKDNGAYIFMPICDSHYVFEYVLVDATGKITLLRVITKATFKAFIDIGHPELKLVNRQ